MSFRGNRLQGIIKKRQTVGFQMYDTAGTEQLFVAVKKHGRSKPFSDFLWLWIGESDPYTRYFLRIKSVEYGVNPHPEESHIFVAVFKGCFGPTPDPGTFYVDANIIVLWITIGEGYGVFTFSATQFEDDGVCILKKVLPMALMLKSGL